jgi:hypothetical protein
MQTDTYRTVSSRPAEPELRCHPSRALPTRLCVNGVEPGSEKQLLSEATCLSLPAPILPSKTANRTLFSIGSGSPALSLELIKGRITVIDSRYSINPAATFKRSMRWGALGRSQNTGLSVPHKLRHLVTLSGDFEHFTSVAYTFDKLELLELSQSPLPSSS